MFPLLIVKTCYFKVGENYIKKLNVHWQQCVQLFYWLWFGKILTIDYEVKIFQEGKKKSPHLAVLSVEGLFFQQWHFPPWRPRSHQLVRWWLESFLAQIVWFFCLFVHHLYAGYILFSSSWHHLKYSFQPTELTTNKETYLTDTVTELVSQKQMTGNTKKWPGED